MTGRVDVLSPGIGVSIQDTGRMGSRHLGVPVSGALDRGLLEAANALLGNPADAAGLEVRWSGPRIAAHNTPVRFAIAGAMQAKEWDSNTLAPMGLVKAWQSGVMVPGQIWQFSLVETGIAYIAFSGAITVTPQLGSRSSYPRALLGGLEGRPLAVGDALPCGGALTEPDLESGSPWPVEGWALPTQPMPLSATVLGQKTKTRELTVRVLLGPQDDYFTPDALERFFTEAWMVGPALDRMGIRLEGSALAHNAKGADIVSDAVCPGAIQVPANGKPLVLLADCQTTGGYPKIATVIAADIDALGHLRQGDSLRFKKITADSALQALRSKQAAIDHWCSHLRVLRPPGGLDLTALYSRNLVSGAPRGDEFLP